MYYVGSYRPKQGIADKDFRSVVEDTNAVWFANNTDDRLKLRLGTRGWPYITIIDSASRIDEWTYQAMTDPQSRVLIERWLGVLDCEAGLCEDFGKEQL